MCPRAYASCPTGKALWRSIMSKEKKKAASRPLEDVFLRYVRDDFSDERASALVPALLEEAAFVEGYSPHDRGCHGFRDAVALKACELLALLPTVRKDRDHRFRHEMPKTKALFWEAIMLGVHYGHDGNMDKYLDGLFTPVERSTAEDKAFKEVLMARFDRSGTFTASKVLHVMRGRARQSSSETLRTMLRSLIGELDYEHLALLAFAPKNVST